MDWKSEMGHKPTELEWSIKNSKIHGIPFQDSVVFWNQLKKKL